MGYHGLPVELGVEKLLGITKEDIGKTITVEEYNSICRREVMKYKDQWEEVTRIMGYWVDMENPMSPLRTITLRPWQLLQNSIPKVSCTKAILSSHSRPLQEPV